MNEVEAIEQERVHGKFKVSIKSHRVEHEEHDTAKLSSGRARHGADKS